MKIQTKKERLEDATIGIVNSLKDFKIDFDEGMLNEQEEKGAYGPYKQSLRKGIYQAYAKYLIEQVIGISLFCNRRRIGRDERKTRNSKNKTWVLWCYGQSTEICQ